MKVWLRTRFCEKSQKYTFFDFSIDCSIVVGMVIYGRRSDIWGAKEAQKTIEHQKIVFRAHFEKIEKNRHFYPKNALKKIFKVDFHRAILPGQQIDIARRYILSGPPNPYILGFITTFLPHYPTCWILVVKSLKATFFGFFHLSESLKLIT